MGGGRRKKRKSRGRGHGILEGSWGLGCRGIGGWWEGEEEDEDGGERGSWDSRGFLGIRLSGGEGGKEEKKSREEEEIKQPRLAGWGIIRGWGVPARIF